jgi:hypothetical protein
MSVYSYTSYSLSQILIIIVLKIIFLFQKLNFKNLNFIIPKNLINGSTKFDPHPSIGFVPNFIENPPP